MIRLTSSKPGAITFRMSFGKGVIPASVRTIGNDTLVLDGHAWEHMHSSGHDGVALQIRVCAIIEGGDSTAGDQAIQIRGADAAIILVAIGTSFNGEDPEAMSREIIQNAARKDYARLKQDHIADYQPLYRRTSIDLGRSSATIRRQPTDVRRKGVENGGDDPELVALFFQYGRYLESQAPAQILPCPLLSRASGMTG